MITLIYLIIICGIIVSFFLTFFIRRLALRFKFLDLPQLSSRKHHLFPVPLLGGVAIYLSFFTVLFFLIETNTIILSSWYSKNIVGLFFASTIIIIGGILDDRYQLRPQQSIWFPIMATITLIGSGVGIRELSNPLGGVFDLTQYEIGLFWFHGTLFKFTFLADLFSIFWLLGMTYTTKVLDGLDGLVGGLTVIGGVILIVFSLSEKYYDPSLALLASILVGSFLGFLILNWHPAKIFLGEGGSLLSGFLLGALAIFSGSKVAMTFLVMGVPILDFFWVIIERIFILRKSPFHSGDRRHLHLRLLDFGWGQKKAVLWYYMLAFLFGLTAIFFQTQGKFFLFFILFVYMILISFFVNKRKKEYEKV